MKIKIEPHEGLGAVAEFTQGNWVVIEGRPEAIHFITPLWHSLGNRYFLTAWHQAKELAGVLNGEILTKEPKISSPKGVVY